jgi:hypothetical protein
MSAPPRHIKINDLHVGHPRIRAKDWRSPLIRRLLGASQYRDSSCDLTESYKSRRALCPVQHTLSLSWAGLKTDFEQTTNTYQEPVITEYATLGVACILVNESTQLQITEVTRRGEKADYWLGDKKLLLEVSGQQDGNLDALCTEKAAQLKANPFGKDGYVCVANYAQRSARLWFYETDEGS